MAKVEETEDLDLDVKSGSKSNTILLIVLLVLLLLIGGGGGAYFLLSGDKGKAGAKHDATKEVVDEKATAENADAGERKPAIYYKLTPEFVVNLDDSSRVNFMQIELQVMVRDELVIPVMEHHMPVIRNNIMLLLSSQKYEEVNKREGKEKLMLDLKDTIQAILTAESSSMEIEAVYITSMVMQ
ncbi:MAG: flagellar basal body-associated FliL family protein [Gammaproteobacteria bacterium]|nr:flagellar basal body-associated FliL family protein [Gammaproteobacteria bacterium]